MLPLDTTSAMAPGGGTRQRARGSTRAREGESWRRQDQQERGGWGLSPERAYSVLSISLDRGLCDTSFTGEATELYRQPARVAY